MNKKGQIGVEAVFGMIVFSMFVAAIVGTPKFREKKAMEVCMDQGSVSIAQCEVIVADVKANGGLSGAKPSYIRDI